MNPNYCFIFHFELLLKTWKILLLWHCKYFEHLILSIINCTSAHWLCEREPWAAWIWKIISGLSRWLGWADWAGLGWLGWAGGVDRQRQRPRVSLATLRAEVVWAQVSGGRGTGDMSTMNDVHQFRSRTPSFLISAEPPTQVHTSKYWHVYRRNIYLDLDLPFAQITNKRKE